MLIKENERLCSQCCQAQPSQAPAGLSIALSASNPPTHRPPGKVVKSWNTSLAVPWALANRLIKLVQHSWQPKLSKS